MAEIRKDSNGITMSYAGRYNLKNPKKYMGVGTNPMYKSRLELIVFNKLDIDEKILRWGYEIIQIPYFCKIDNKIHKYKVDIYCESKNETGIIRSLIEIKSSEEVRPIKKPTLMNPRSRQRYKESVRSHIVNESKWRAAVDFCKKSNIKMMILTEKDIEKL